MHSLSVVCPAAGPAPSPQHRPNQRRHQRSRRSASRRRSATGNSENSMFSLDPQRERTHAVDIVADPVGDEPRCHAARSPIARCQTTASPSGRPGESSARRCDRAARPAPRSGWSRWATQCPRSAHPAARLRSPAAPDWMWSELRTFHQACCKRSEEALRVLNVQPAAVDHHRQRCSAWSALADLDRTHAPGSPCVRSVFMPSALVTVTFSTG